MTGLIALSPFFYFVLSSLAIFITLRNSFTERNLNPAETMSTKSKRLETSEIKCESHDLWNITD